MAGVLPTGAVSQLTTSGPLPTGDVEQVAAGGGGGDTTPPEFPVGAAISLVGGTLTQTGAQIEWTAATDAVGPVTYRISTDGGATYPITGLAATNHTFSGLTAGTTYAVRVRAFDGAGNASVDILAYSLTTLAAGATITTPPLHDPETGVVLASIAVTWYCLYDNTTQALVLRKTGLATSALGVITFSDASLVPGTVFRHGYLLATGHTNLPSAAAA